MGSSARRAARGRTACSKSSASCRGSTSPPSRGNKRYCRCDSKGIAASGWMNSVSRGKSVGAGCIRRRAIRRRAGRYGEHHSRRAGVDLFARGFDWLAASAEPPEAASLSSVGQQILELLQQRGAMFATDILAAAQLLPTQLDDVLGGTGDGGFVTSDGFAGLRGLIRRIGRNRATPHPATAAPSSSVAAGQSRPRAAGRCGGMVLSVERRALRWPSTHRRRRRVIAQRSTDNARRLGLAAPPCVGGRLPRPA